MSVHEESSIRRSAGEPELARRESARVVSVPASVLAKLQQTFIDLKQIEQELENALREPVAQGTINFDEAPFLLWREQTLASGTDLTVDQPYTPRDGVTFTGIPGPQYTGTPSGRVYAAAWVGAPSQPNVCSLYDGVHTIAPFSDADGQVRAQFNPAVKSVTIEAVPMWASPETLAQMTTDAPYMKALDANGNAIDEDDYALSGSGNWGTVTLQVAQPNMQAAAMIAAVEFSVKAGTPNVYLVVAVFDNLTFQR
jgi:hypothetical protein